MATCDNPFVGIDLTEGGNPMDATVHAMAQQLSRAALTEIRDHVALMRNHTPDADVDTRKSLAWAELGLSHIIDWIE